MSGYGAILRGGPFLFQRMGELLGEMVKPGPNSFHDGRNLKDIGIDHNQSHRYQRMARVPNNELETSTHPALDRCFLIEFYKLDKWSIA